MEADDFSIIGVDGGGGFKKVATVDDASSSKRNGSISIDSSNSSNRPRRKLTIVLNFDETFSFANYDELVEVCQDNRQYFESDDSEMGQRFHEQFESIINHIDAARKYVTEFNGFMHEYDFDHRTPGNGYRSLVKAMHAAIDYCLKVCNYIAKNRRYLLFRRSVYIK